MACFSVELEQLDLFGELPILKKSGGYDSLDDLLDTVFRLEREDCFYPLREGVCSIRNLAGKRSDLPLIQPNSVE